jgi:hypothetical protein
MVSMDLSRIVRHLFATIWSVRRAFPQSSLDAIERAIQKTEATHEGQVRFAVEHALDLPPLLAGQSARERAVEVFSQLRVWDTEHDNGVLIYLLLADRDVEIVADRGIHAHVGGLGGDLPKHGGALSEGRVRGRRRRRYSCGRRSPGAPLPVAAGRG